MNTNNLASYLNQLWTGTQPLYRVDRSSQNFPNNEFSEQSYSVYTRLSPTTPQNIINIQFLTASRPYLPVRQVTAFRYYMDSNLYSFVQVRNYDYMLVNMTQLNSRSSANHLSRSLEATRQSFTLTKRNHYLLNNNYKRCES